MSLALIVGLGNPGVRYANTRHNVGFWLIDQIALQQKAQFRREAKFHGEVCRLEQPSCWLLKPDIFMNLSGKAVAALANFYKISVNNILIIHDDLDFPVGTVRLKRGGSDGKHNGLKDIIARLGNPDFMRLRIGIGHPGRGADVSNYVLNAPTPDEQIAIIQALDNTLATMPLLFAGHFDKAMQQLHSQKSSLPLLNI